MNKFNNTKLSTFLSLIKKGAKYRWALNLGRILLYIFIDIILFFIAVDINFLFLFGSTPSISKDKDPNLAVASELYTSDSVLIGRYFHENRSPVEYNEIPKVLINALVATEDARFFQHQGIDVRATFSVFWYMLKGDNRGGSTISQQLAKNLFKTRKRTNGLFDYIPGVRTLIAKTKEWITAVKLEYRYSKEEILTMYLNTVDFGSNSFGIKVASKTFFNKLPINLNIQESALLIGILKAPTMYSPIHNPKKSKARRNIVLDQMLKYNYIDQRVHDSVCQLPLVLHYNVLDANDNSFGSYIRTAVANYLKEWSKKTGYNIYTSGLKIYTSIDSKIQHYAEESVYKHLRQLQNRFDNHWGKSNPWIDDKGKEIPDFIEDYVKTTSLYSYLQKKYKNNGDSIDYYLNKPKIMKVFTWKGEKEKMFSSMDSIRYYKHFLNAGFMVMDAYTGQVKAWVGGINYKFFKYDHIKQAKRQPGSTFKPFVYLTALDNGYTPCDRIEDKRVTINYTENGVKKSWSPHNSDWKYTGRRMTLRHALAKSCNSVTAQLTQIVGADKVVKYAKRCGIDSPLKPVPSIGLGSNDVSLFEMVRAYCTFINNGYRTEPMLVVKITDREGKIIEAFQPKRIKVLSDITAYLMTYMLKGGLEEPGGTSQALWDFADMFGDNEIGGKTGTSSNYSDGWFMGVTKGLVCGAWVGGEDRCIHFKKTEKMEGSKMALPIYGMFMTKCYKDPSTHITKGSFPKYLGNKKVDYYCPTPWEKKDTTDENSISNKEKQNQDASKSRNDGDQNEPN